ncbi:adenosylcobinamide-GDP ribazoletransferase [Henriciella sp.]|uniref:adenosylcobinamide-GDP ribazoletransferase n=1 Tax=Henriciella sp. TaxID=1968823 RepID=UPI002602528C|nr:adenosylcobinamide-GDP ribazoletransferase [Henriciella sp.]
MKDELAKLALAIQFLTRLPVPDWFTYTPERMAASVRYYPLTGLLIGSLCASIYWSATLAFPAIVAVLLALVFGAILTGAFHEDGLADTFDGIGGGLTREASLTIMKDSRVGTYGVLGLAAIFALKLAALVSLPVVIACLAFPVAHGLSRLSAVLVIATSRYVRDEGTGKPVASGVSVTSLVVAGMSGGALIALWLLFQPAFALLYALAGLALGHALMRLFFERKLGGYTGDTLGAVQQVSETGFYLGLLAWL